MASYLAAAGAIAMVGWGIVISMALAILGVFLTLVIRKLLITLLIILSPFAFIFWILPNTSKWFGVWMENFVKLVMMFPMVMMLFEAGRIFALAAGAFTGNTAENTVRPLLQMAGYIIPLFAIPMTFSWAGKGLAFGQNAAKKATGFIDKRYGNHSNWAHDRQHTREAVNSLKAVDFSQKGFGAAVKRGFAAKRSGQAGFFAHASMGTKKDEQGNVVGLKKIPVASWFGIGADEATRNRLHKTAQHTVDEEAASEAIDEMRHNQPQSSADRMRNIQSAAYSKLFEQRRVEEMLATKNKDGVSVKDIPVTSATTEDVTNAKAEYKAAIQSGDQASVKKANLRMISALQNSTGGMDQMEGMIREEVNKGDGANQARVAAILTRLGSSQSGVDRAVALGTGFVEPDPNRPGHFIGGNGKNADGSDAVLGGHDNAMTSNKWAPAWSSGMAKATGLDINKSLAAAVSDMSADQVARSSAPQMRRVMAYVDRNMQPGGDPEVAQAARTTLNDAVRAVKESDPLKAKILVDTRNVIASASESDTPIIDPVVGAWYRSTITEPSPPPVVPEQVAQQIIQATGGDAVHSAQIHQKITQEMTGTDLRSSQTYTNIENHILENGPLAPEDLPRLGAPAAPAPLPEGHVAPGPAVSQRMAQQFKQNLDALAAAQQHYATNESYRAKVDSAYQRDVNIPPAPPPPPA
ncbi:MAG: hypothetical protein K0S68_632 [Candidatus Saccharibacteria bacterium]|nr:hypothetical protein [Candidatus Saccharibacteria bacterium]